MASLIIDTLAITQKKFPVSLRKKRIILNLFYLYFISIPHKLRNVFKPQDDRNFDKKVTISSQAWDSLDHVIKMYLRYLPTHYLMRTLVIKNTMTGWNSKDFIEHLKITLTDSFLKIVPESTHKSVKKVAAAMQEEFSGLDENVIFRWLMSYQYGLFTSSEDTQALEKTLQDHIIIELGAGIGANAAVHAHLSNKEVYLFDIPPVLAVQKRTINAIEKHLELAPVQYYDDVDILLDAAKGKKYIVVSNWAFSEFPLDLRARLEPLIDGATFSNFSCNPIFEGVKNLSYFEDLKERLNKSMIVNAVTWLPMKNHNCILLKRHS